MANGEALFVFNSLYEPQEENGFWIVHYKRNNKWEQETCATREQAVAFYQKKARELRSFYTRFLREIGVQK